VLHDLLKTRIPADGGSDTVNRGEMRISDPEEPFLDRHGAGLRMILDFADLDASRFMMVPGESGNPLSPHYSDLLRPWRDFAWLTLGRAAGGETLVLAPK
jgi:penicillin G amidase